MKNLTIEQLAEKFNNSKEATQNKINLFVMDNFKKMSISST